MRVTIHASEKQVLEDLITLSSEMAARNDRCGRLTVDTETQPNRAWVCLRPKNHVGDCTPEEVRKVVPF